MPDESEPPRKPPPAALPASVGPYRPQSVLGLGGMATVYLAEADPSAPVQGLFALKVPHPKLSAQSTYLQMFLQEARLAVEIEHPHVCRVFGFGRDEAGTAYLAMEYLRGCSLATVTKQLGAITNPVQHAARVARVLADACEGLQAIHEHGQELETPPRVVHRDISPDNLFLTTQGFVKIIDFGLAKSATAGAHTEPGFVKGKMSYIAPELLQGAPATPQSDLWSLGVVAWELLTGQRLFNADTDLETLLAVKHQPVPKPSSLVAGLHKALDAVVLRALNRVPEQRYRSAAEFAEVLWAYLARGTVVQHRDLAAAWVRESPSAPPRSTPTPHKSTARGRLPRMTLRRSALVLGITLTVAVSCARSEHFHFPALWASEPVRGR